MRGIVLTLFLLLLLPVGIVDAQISAAGVGAVAQIELQPAFPGPFSTVKATLNDYATDATGAIINWRINGVVQKSLENQRSVELEVGDIGKNFTIEALLTSSDGTRLSATQVITPAYLDLIVEPQTRVPQFYKGRALPSLGSTVNLSALVNAGNTTKESLVYTWSMNGTVLLGGPVRGQNQISITMPQGGALLNISIERAGGGVIASKSVQLNNTLPFLKFYTVNSLYGVSKRPIKDSLSLIGNSTNVRAEPYNLDIRTFNDPDLLEWNIAGQTVAPVSTNPYEINLVRQGGTQITSIGFHVRNLTQVLQGAEASFYVQ
jgi:hypothetical protein